MILSPLITVLMPTYNCEAFVKEAVESILNQTFVDFEFLIIDDNSTDNTVSIIKSLKDKRIQLFVKPKNTGYTQSLNYGLSIAKGDFIARMDADDISMPNRLAKQVAFLKNNKEIVACGTNYTIINSNEKKILPENNEDIKLKLLKETCFGHPTVMLRKSIIDKHDLKYDTTKEPAEDYALWVTLLRYGKLYNLQDYLLKYRLHESQVSVKQRAKQLKSKLETRVNILKYLNADLSTNNYDILKKVINNDKLTYKEIKNYSTIKNKLIKANSNNFFHPVVLKNYLIDMNTVAIRNYFTKRKQFYPTTFWQYMMLIKKTAYRQTSKQAFKLLFKSLIFYKVK